jgi:hypothetical protein
MSQAKAPRRNEISASSRISPKQSPHRHAASSSSAAPFSVDSEKKLVTVRFRDQVTAADIEDYAARLQEHPGFDPGFSEMSISPRRKNLTFRVDEFLKLADKIDPFFVRCQARLRRPQLDSGPRRSDSQALTRSAGFSDFQLSQRGPALDCQLHIAIVLSCWEGLIPAISAWAAHRPSADTCEPLRVPQMCCHLSEEPGGIHSQRVPAAR